MSDKSNPRRLALLGVIVLALVALAAWRFMSGGAPEPDEASVTKAEELQQRYIEAGGSLEPLEEDADVDLPEGNGPQEIDD